MRGLPPAFACVHSLRVLAKGGYAACAPVACVRSHRVRAFVERAYNSCERAALLHAEHLGPVSHFLSPVMSRGGNRTLTGKVLPVLIGGVIRVITPEPAKVILRGVRVVIRRVIVIGGLIRGSGGLDHFA